MDGWIERLTDALPDYEGPVRVVAYPSEALDPVDWPLDWPLATIEYAPEPPLDTIDYAIGMSALIPDAGDAAQLRALWREQPNPDAADLSLSISDAVHDDGTYDVWLRDALPFEDEQGLFSPSARCHGVQDCGGTCIDGWCAER